MQHSQLLSPAARATRRRSAREGGGATRVRPHSDTVLDGAGNRVSWATLMREALWRGDERIPAHAALEMCEVRCADDVVWPAQAQLGARVRLTAAPLPPDTFLGFYEGWVGTPLEAARGLYESTPLGDRALRFKNH